MPKADHAQAALEECCHEALREMLLELLKAKDADFTAVQKKAQVNAMRRGVAHADAERWVKDGWPKVLKRFRERLNRLGVY